MPKKWFEEELYTSFDNDQGYKQSFVVGKDIVTKKSEFQEIKIFENEKFGKILTLDGVIQTTERDEFFYHEMFVHVPLISHFLPKSVLIIGGGDGGILREVLKHNTLERVVMIEIDGDVIDLCDKYMPKLSQGAFKDKRADVRVADGIEFVRETKEKFDVIIVDSTDPINVGEVLFTDEFYQNARRCLNNGGILSTQSGVPFFQEAELRNIDNRLAKVFQTVTFYVVPVPTYIGGFMCLSFASDDINNVDLDIKTIGDKINRSGLADLNYYNAKIHQASFTLPEYISKILNKK